MSKKIRIAIGVICAAVLVLIAAWMLIKKNAIKVASDDGTANIEIPRSSLPEGVDASQIKIKRTENYTAEDPNERIFTYSLEPAGLVLKEPVKVTITLPQNAEGIPFVLHISDNGIESLGNMTAVANGSTTVVTGEVRHFSELAAELNDHVVNGLGGTFQRDNYVGEAFEVDVVLSVRESERNIIRKNGDKITIKFKEPATLTDGELYARSANIAPANFKDTPAKLEIKNSGRETINKQFTCKKFGKISIGHKMNASFAADFATYDENGALISENKNVAFNMNLRYDPNLSGHCLTPPDDTAPQYTKDFKVKTTDVLTFKIGDRFYPVENFGVSSPHLRCEIGHHHAFRRGKYILSIDLQKLDDPAPDGCGYGTIADLTKTEKALKVPEREAKEFYDALEKLKAQNP